MGLTESVACGLTVQWPQHLALRGDALVDLDRLGIERIGQYDPRAKISGRAW